MTPLCPHGDLTVTDLVVETGTQRVYNMSVEADHVYYVGELNALAHNICGPENEPEKGPLGAINTIKDAIAQLEQDIKNSPGNDPNTDTLWRLIEKYRAVIDKIVSSN